MTAKQTGTSTLTEVEQTLLACLERLPAEAREHLGPRYHLMVADLRRPPSAVLYTLPQRRAWIRERRRRRKFWLVGVGTIGLGASACAVAGAPSGLCTACAVMAGITMYGLTIVDGLESRSLRWGRTDYGDGRAVAYLLELLPVTTGEAWTTCRSALLRSLPALTIDQARALDTEQWSLLRGIVERCARLPGSARDDPLARAVLDCVARLIPEVDIPYPGCWMRTVSLLWAGAAGEIEQAAERCYLAFASVSRS